MGKIKSTIKILSITVLFLLGTCLTVYAADVAKIGETTYSTLLEAIAEVSDGGTIILTADADGGFDVGNSSGTAPKNFTIDLAEYTIDFKKPVGSTNTVTNGIRVLANSELTLKNGKITASSEDILVGLANYGTLTLENVTVNSGINTQYTINNRGELTLKGNTTVETSKATPNIAITNDPYNYYYTNTNATLNIADKNVTVGVVQVELYGNAQNSGVPELNISAGTIEEVKDDGSEAIEAIGNITGGTYSKAVDKKFCADCFTTKENSEGKFEVVELTKPELETNIGTLNFKVGELTEFTFSTVANDYKDVMVYGGSNFSDEDAIEVLEYKQGDNWIDMKGQNFGGANGFPMADATSTFRVKFSKSGDYTFTASMKEVGTDKILCSTEVEFTVKDKVASTITTNIGEKEFTVGKAVEFTFTTTANDDAGKMVIGTSNFSNKDAIEKLEYLEVADNTWHELSGDFGPASGFPMSDATSKFRVTFKTAGDYTFTASMKEVGTDKELCSTEVKFTVSKKTTSSGGGNGGGTATTTYKITVVKSENGTISPDGTVKVTKGNDKKFTIKANNNYEIEDVLVDDKSVGAVSTYTFENVKDNHTIEAKFKKIEEKMTSTYKDVTENDWYFEAIEYVTSKGIMEGVEKGYFNPKANATRAMVVTILYNLEGKPAVEGETSYVDVEKGSWYESPIAWAEANGIVKGIGENQFAPDENVTREQLVTILYRYAQFKKSNVTIEEKSKASSYEDFSQSSEYAIPSIQWACDNDLLLGRTETTIVPKGMTTRAELATFFMRFLEK